MPASVFDSGLYRDLFGDAEVAKLFTDSAEVRAMLLVLGALAEVQGRLGLIPETAGAYIHRAAREVPIDPAALSRETGDSAVAIPALVKAFRAAMNAPDHARYLHWGATSQDIVDTALMLRLRQVLVLFEDRLKTLARSFGHLARRHADLPMAGRTYGQAAVPTTFGAVAAGWGGPLFRHLDRLAELRPRLLAVSLGGAAGTLSAMGAEGPAVRAALARALDLADPGASWHAERDRIGELAGWLGLVLGSLGKFGEDLILMTQSGIAEVRLGASGGSSTMPQKRNPVAPSLIVALARHGIALGASIQSAAPHRQQRDGAAWMTEQLALPGLVAATGRALAAATDLAATLQPDPARMQAAFADGLIHAEALTFALAARMPRPQAQAEVTLLADTVLAEGGSLVDRARARWPDLDLTVPDLGTAPADARRYADRTRDL